MCILSNLSRQFSAFRPDHLIAVSLVLIFYFEIVFNGEKNLPDYPTILLLLLDFKQTFFFLLAIITSAVCTVLEHQDISS